MRYQDRQYDQTHPEVVKSEPVPVPPPDRDERTDENLDLDRREQTTYDSRTRDDRATDEALVDRGTFDDPVTADERTHAGRADDDRATDEALVDRGTFDDPVTVDERADADGGDDGLGTRRDATVVDDARDDSGFGHADTDRDLTGTDRGPSDTGPVGAEADPDADDRTEPMPSGGVGAHGLGSTHATRDPDFDRTEAASDATFDRSDYDRDHVAEPAPQPTTFGAATVGGAAAAAAAAGHGRGEPQDLRDEDTARRGDGTVDDQQAYGDEIAGDRYADSAAVAGDRGPDADATADGQPVGEVAPAGQLMPGDVPAEPVAALLSAERGQNFRDRWREVQLRFVDDPRAAATDAQRLVEDAIESLTSALAEQRDNLGGWDTGEAGDTEKMRVAVRRYRDFLDRLLGL